MTNKTKFKKLSSQIDTEIKIHLENMRIRQYIQNLQDLAYCERALDRIADRLTELIIN